RGSWAATRYDTTIAVGLRVLRAALLEQFCHEPGPARLVACADAGTVVAVEVFMEQHEVPPVRIVVKLLHSPIDRPPSVCPPQENAEQPRENYLEPLQQGLNLPGPVRAYHFES